jgi:beta-lactam-binding protein with PASTA domain/tRNA A-37 threonylcarbamoyl transferase component Bud32
VSTLRIADAVGRVLGGQYRLIRPVGSGPSAHVYVAEDVTLRRRVAVKVLHPGLADDRAFLRRFREEAQVIATLEHPNIQRVYDWGEDGGSPYLVSELLEGGSLRALLDGGHLLTQSQVVALGLSAARALQHARSRGVVHGDIKPANLLFDHEGRLCVADFGLARALAAATWVEPAAGRYAAPEQALGLSVDSRADVYALALVLTEATTNVVPFASDTPVAALMARTARPLEGPEEAGPLAPIIEAAGTISPDDRLDPMALVRALESLASTLPVPGPMPLAGLPAGPSERGPEQTRLTGFGLYASDQGRPVGLVEADAPPSRPDDGLGFVHQPPAVPVVALPVAWGLATRAHLGTDPEPGPARPEAGAAPQAGSVPQAGASHQAGAVPEAGDALLAGAAPKAGNEHAGGLEVAAGAAPTAADDPDGDEGDPTVAWGLQGGRPPARLYDGAEDWALDDPEPVDDQAYAAETWDPGAGAAPSGWGVAGAVDPGWAWGGGAPNGGGWGDGAVRTSLGGAVDPAMSEAAATAGPLVAEPPSFDFDGEQVWSDDDDEPGRHRWLAWLAGAIILFLLSVGGTAAWIVSHRPATPLAVVPSLRGDTVSQARQALVRDHLALVVSGRAYDPHARSGTIIGRQAPAAGRRVRRNARVAVTVSRGPKPVDVPSLRHLTRYRARKRLAAVGLKIGTISRTTSVTVPVDDIISSTPSRGTLLPGQSVAIVISTGKPKVAVPLLQGKTIDSYAAASAALKKLHFATTEEVVYNNTVPAGEVIVTDPAPHVSVVYGTSVTVLVSKGADLVQVPDVQNDTVAAADKTLAAYGFVVSGVTGSPNGTVIGTDPAQGSLKLYGSSVQIITNKAHRHRRK